MNYLIFILILLILIYYLIKINKLNNYKKNNKQVKFKDEIGLNLEEIIKIKKNL